MAGYLEGSLEEGVHNTFFFIVFLKPFFGCIM